MAFTHNGMVWFPEIPFLTINDHWLGVGGDEGKMILIVNQGIWGKRCHIVELDHWCYDLVDNDDNFPTLHPVKFENIRNGITKCDNVWWRTTNNHTLSNTLNGWRLESSSFGAGNYYSVTFGNDTATARPQGPWTDGDNPPARITFHIDWPRWQGTRGNYGAANIVDNYTPPTDYCDEPPSGNIRVGCPTWNNSQLGTVTRTAQYTDWDNHLYSYLFANGNGFRPDPTDYTKVTCTIGETTYTGPIPNPDQSWTVTYKDSDGNTQTKTFSASSWVKGNETVKRKMFEIMRLM